MKTWKIIGLIVLFLIGFGVFNFVCKYSHNASNTLYNQTNAEILLKRYEQFKEMAQQLDAKTNDILVQEGTVQNIEKMYVNVPRNEWQRADIDAYNSANQALSSIKMSYNKLAAQYNADLSKINYLEITKHGQLPKTYVLK